jgi:hypothetical protein
MNYSKVEDVILRWPTPGSRTWLEQFLARMTDDENVRAVVAVGSTVRPDVQSEDLDLVLVTHDRQRFASKAPIEVDIRPFALKDIDERIAEGDSLLVWAVRFGRPLLDKDETWSNVVDRWHNRLPLPNARAERERADRFLARLTEVLEIGDQEAAAELRVSHLTALARAALSEHGVPPISRPELPDQLRSIGQHQLALQLEMVLEQRQSDRTIARRAV